MNKFNTNQIVHMYVHVRVCVCGHWKTRSKIYMEVQGNFEEQQT